MKVIVAADRAEARAIARRANVARGWPAAGKAATEADRRGGGIHVPLELVVTTHEAAVVEHPVTKAVCLRVRLAAELAAGDRARAVDAVLEEWEPARETTPEGAKGEVIKKT